MRLICLLPAAGKSSRMRGKDKLSEFVDGEPCLRVMTKRALLAGFEVVVTVPALNHPRAKLLEDMHVQILPIPDAHEGMAASLRRGVGSIMGFADGVMILPPDMPALEWQDIRDVKLAFQTSPDCIVQATTASGQSGHPVIFPKATHSMFASLEGDHGAASIIRHSGATMIKVPLANNRARLDLDTPEAWVEWRASRL